MDKKIILYILTLSIIGSTVLAQNNYRTNLIIEDDNNSKVITASVLDGKENIVTVKKSINAKGSIPAAIATRNGNLAILNSLDGILELYDQTSEQILSYKFYNHKPYNEQAIKYSLNNNGIVFLVSEERENTLYFIGNIGEREKLGNCKTGLVTGISSNISGNKIAYSVVNWINNELIKNLVLMDLESGSKQRYSVDFEEGTFQEQNNLFFGRNKKSAFCIDYKSEKLLWKDELLEDEYYVNLTPSQDNVILIKANEPKLENGNWIYTGASIVQKNIAGAEVVLQKVNESFRTIEVIESNNNLEVMIDSKLELLR